MAPLHERDSNQNHAHYAQQPRVLEPRRLPEPQQQHGAQPLRISAL